MRGLTTSFLFSVVFLALPGTSLEGQDQAPLRFSIREETREAEVELGDLLTDPELQEAMRSGLPLRIRILIQLWRDGFFDDQKGQHEWRGSVVFDPLTRRYRVQSGGPGNDPSEVNTIEEARDALQETLTVPLRPLEVGRYYYLAEVEVETLSLSDLEELQRWLKGDLAQVAAGEGDVEGALSKGFKRVLVRVLDLPARRFRVRSPSFRWEGG